MTLFVLRWNDKYLDSLYWEAETDFKPNQSTWTTHLEDAWLFDECEAIAPLAVAMNEGQVFIESVRSINGTLSIV